jgi:hypothetical protein
MSRCRSCNAEIVWARTAAGKRMPLDAQPTRTGNVQLGLIGGQEVAIVVNTADALAAQAAGLLLYASHFSSCPNAAQHRRATEPARAQAKPKEGQVICDA